MEVIELSYKKPPPLSITVGLYRIVDGVYIEVNGGGYVRQKYTGATLSFPQATGDWGKVIAIGITIRGKQQFFLLAKAYTIHVGDQFNLSLQLESV